MANQGPPTTRVDAAPPAPSRLRRWAGRAYRVTLAVMITEVLLRGVLLGWGHWARPSCGARPELLPRLLFAYSRSRPAAGREVSPIQLSDPHRGWRHSSNLRDQELWGARMSTNRHGMRGTKDYAVPKPAGLVRVAALGDSFTFGEGVPDDATWPAQLEAAIPGLEVMNLGERAYAHDQMYFALRDDGLPLQPDVVILGFFHADVWRDEVSFYCNEKPRFAQSGGRWVVENVPVPTPRETYDRARRLPLVYAVPRLLIEAMLQPRMTNDLGTDRAAEALRRIRELTASVGARFIMVNISDHVDASPDGVRFFADYCARTGAECVDSAPLFAELAKTSTPAAMVARYRRPHDVHYSRAGYAVVTEALRRHLATRPLTPASAPAAARQR